MQKMRLISYTHPDFWKNYNKLPKEIKELADKKFDLFKKDPNHPSLGFAKKGKVWTALCEYRASL